MDCIYFIRVSSTDPYTEEFYCERGYDSCESCPHRLREEDWEFMMADIAYDEQF